MNNPDAFDAQAREVYARSLEHLSPRVHAQLAQRRRAARQGMARASRGLLPWAGMATAGLALVLLMQLRPSAPASHGDASVATSTAASASPSRVAAVDTRMARTDVDAIEPDLAQDPEFYLWLGDARPSTVE